MELWEQSPLKSKEREEERGPERRWRFPGDFMPLGTTTPYTGLDSIRKPREKTHVVLGDLCLPVPFLHPVISPHPSLHLALQSSPGTGRFKEGREERGN